MKTSKPSGPRLPPGFAGRTQGSVDRGRARLPGARRAAGFTTDTICAEAKVSRGLITHHFGSKDGLLAAIYETMIALLIAVTQQPGTGAKRVAAIIDATFEGGSASRDSLRIWLALWGEIAGS